MSYNQLAYQKHLTAYSINFFYYQQISNVAFTPTALTRVNACRCE